MNKTLKIMLRVAIVAIVCMALSAFAADDFIQTTAEKLASLFKDVRQIVYILGAFALVVFAWLAINGKLEWKKVAILAIGLAVLAIAEQVIQYAIGKDNNTAQSLNSSTWQEIVE